MDSVRVENVVKSYGSVEALRGLDATFPEGAVGLLGPNGAGKSTLLKILLGLVAPDSGVAEVRGIDVTDDPTQVRRRVGYMPEVDAVLPGLTGAQSALFAGQLCGLPRRDAHRRAHEVLYYVGLGEERYRNVDEYTAGMRQRLRMAQALVHDPELVLLDEPTNGLDPAGRDEILVLIRDLARVHRKSVILCTHLLHDVEAVCDHVVVLTNGRKAVQGSIEELRRMEQGRWRVRVRGDQESFRRALEAAGAEYIGIDEEMVQARLPSGEGARLVFRAAATADCVVRELSTSEETLTGAFLRAVETAG
jgi:ABC-2 type transport system ATP-binding protein